MAALPDVSVVIPTRNGRDLVVEAIRALADQTLTPARYEVVVVIDGSTDGTADALDGLTLPFALRCISGSGRGRAAACNAGIRAALGDVVVLLDDDMLASRELLEAHRRGHLGTERSGVVGPVPIAVTRDSAPVVRYVGRKFNRHLRHLAEGGAIGVRDLYTGNFSIRRSEFEDVGLFDEDFTMYGNEDLELGVRLRKAGVHLTYAPEAVASQRYVKTFADLARDNEAKGHTAVLLARKHPEVTGELKFGARSSLKLRAVRAMLLGLTRLNRATPRLVLGSVAVAERVAPWLTPLLYPVAIDYFYWLGASAELKKGGSPTPERAVADGGSR